MAFPLFAPRRPQPASGASLGEAEVVSGPPEAASASLGGARAASASLGGARAASAAAPRVVHSYAREAAALVLLASALYTTLALASFQGDPLRAEVTGGDWVGPVGAAYAGFA